MCVKRLKDVPVAVAIPVKDVETAPWRDIAVDLAGPWTATIDGKKVKFLSLTIIDPKSYLLHLTWRILSRRNSEGDTQDHHVLSTTIVEN
jgi:hypothetical protein